MAVRVVHRGIDGERVVDLDIDDPRRTVADLLDALGSPRPVAASVVIDGHDVASPTPLGDAMICEGSVIDTVCAATADASSTTTPDARVLAVSGGIRAGRVVPIDGPIRVGRDPAARLWVDDPGLCPRHFELRTGLVRDLGSRNGTAVEGHPLVGPAPAEPAASIRAGTSRFSIRPVVADRPVAVEAGLGLRAGTIPFNRPPRIAPPVDPVPLTAPGPAPEPPAREALSVAGIVLPVVAGAVVAVLFSPYMAIFAALGPVLTVGTWWERRRRARRDHRRELSEHAAALDGFAASLPGHRRAEIGRRRSLQPDPAEVVRRATHLSVRVWERRADHPDAFAVALGADDEPLILQPQDDEPGAEAAALLAALPLMPDVPVVARLGPGSVVGLVGDRRAARAVLRSLIVQMATHHGPADLAIVVGADDPTRWAWAGWLPHVADPAGCRRAAGVIRTDAVPAVEMLLTSLGERAVLAVLDGDDPFQGRATVGRRLLDDDRSGVVVLVDDAHRLPAGCDVVVSVDELGRLEIVDPRRPHGGRGGLGWGLSVPVAEHAARRLARLDDPELPILGAGIPASVSLLSLLDTTGDDEREIERRWCTTDGTADLAVPIGADGEGPLLLDLVADGPHLLVAGTTGAGKSELLRSLVAGVAATADPDHVAMVLIDYKGGAAFDCCAELPHVAGLVTDLDATLAARALRCLDAELRHRETRLREAGAEDLRAFRARCDGADEPLPRLLVVVDEFASLSADLPEFLDALVGVAQRGRSLGVHLVLATQRPGGVVTDDIRANTSARIALRVTDRTDSVDVIDSPDAAAIPRGLPGRSIARLGPGDVMAFHAALATGRSVGRPGVSVRGATDASVEPGGSTDLERLVASIGRAHRRRGGRLPRSPWPPPLPLSIARAELADRAIDLGPADWLVVDDPDHQRQDGAGWVPADGHLVVVGGPGSGLTTTLATAALSVARGGVHHLHVIDLASGDLAGLDALAVAGTVVPPGDAERRTRLVRWLDAEVGRRRAAATGDQPPLVVLIDDFGGLARAHDPVREPAIHDRLQRVWADGPAVGVTLAVSLRRAADLPPDLAATAGTVLLHRSPDQSDALRFAVSEPLSELPPGRAIRAADGATVHVVREAETVAAAVAAHGGPAPASPPHEVGVLPALIDSRHPDVDVSFSAGVTTVTVAIGDRDLTGHPLPLHAGQHALVIGAARSGRTTTLAAIARAAVEHVVVVGDGELARRTGLVPTTPAALDSAIQGRGAALVLVDDATEVDDGAGHLARLVAGAPLGVHVVAATRPDRLRGAYGHWVTELRASRAGFLLRPDPIDGDLLGVQLPPRLTLPPVPGRAVAVSDGTTEVVQIVCPPDQSTS